MTTKLTPLRDLPIQKYQIPAYGLIPNTSLQHKPLLVYKHTFPPSCTASTIESHLSSMGVVAPQWRFTMYSTSHFHSTTHEVLSISCGSARLCFGHEDNPQKVEVEVQKGDVVVVPAGVAHRLLEEKGEGGRFEMVGAYPRGCKQWDMCYGRDGEERVKERIERLAWFERDPVYGDEGPVLEV